MQNAESFSDTKQYKVTRKSKVGSILLALIIAGSISGTITHQIQNYYQQKELDAMIPSFSISTTIEDINNMNLILNDDDCSDTFFEGVANQLKEDGIQFTTTCDCEDINQNNATIVTLDQQYSAGPGTIIFAPYDNARVGQSDSLALSMQAAFKQNGFIVDDVMCGQVGYEQDEDGTIHTFFPTDTEKAMDEGYDSSFVTISFGTQIQNAEWVAKSIENGLARQNYHLKSDDSPTDLIYRANSGDEIDDVANYFRTDSNKLRKFNHMSDSTFTDSQTVVNPSIEEMHAFDKTGMFQIGEEKTRAY